MCDETNIVKDLLNLCTTPNNSNSSDSEWGLEIVIKSTPKKRRKKSINIEDKKVIDEFEKEIDETLEEKAAKSNLSHFTVKSILKHVFTDEHVLALVKQKEGCEDVEGIIPYEPKITRSKAKELFSNDGPVIGLPWQTPRSSEVQALLNEDFLQEESSGDEYIPGEESEEDDISVTNSVNSTPTTSFHERSSSRQSNISETFKTPKSKRKKNEPNIALRTRSKLSLSQTPLEKIEQAFIPPDITTDMYDMDCKDEEWKKFLKWFAQPLDEVKNAEDEDHDPEYNILADEEINEVDKEELRADKAVKVPKKELNDLMAELHEYFEIYYKNADNEFESNYENHQNLLDDCIEILDSSKDLCNNTFQDEILDEKQSDMLDISGAFSPSQLLLLEQQMRQHVQMLTQNFLLSYHHPYYWDLANYMKEYLLNLKNLSLGKEKSIFKPINFEGSLKLIEDWEEMFNQNKPEALNTLQHFEEVMEKAFQAYERKEYYHLPIPPLILETISNNDVFIYPQLLPKIPFKHPNLVKRELQPFTNSEYQLIALGLEQFIPHFINDKKFITRKKELNIKKLTELIHSVLLPARTPNQVYRQILENKKEKRKPNPIAYYFFNNRAPLTLHQVIALDNFTVVSPRNRPLKLLPRQWRTYILENYETKNSQSDEGNNGSYSINAKILIPAEIREEPKVIQRKILPKPEPEETSTRKLIDLDDIYITIKKNERYFPYKKFVKCFRSKITYFKFYQLRRKNILEVFESELLNTEDIMLPSMPCLNSSDGSNFDCKELIKSESKSSLSKSQLIFEHSSGKQNLICKNEMDDKDVNKTRKIEKCNVEEMIPSSEIKMLREKSLLEKKKAKKKKEYLSSLAMLSSPDPISEKDKREQFAYAFIEKMKETLEPNDYKKVRTIFQTSDEKLGNAVDLYCKLDPILRPKYKDIADEFLLFLDAEQAKAVGQLIPFFLMNHMAKFSRNLEIYFKDQPSQLKKIHKSLTELKNGTNICFEKVKNTILPLLKGNPLLCDGFLQIFLEETPTSTLMNGAWEVIDVNKEAVRPDAEAVLENMNVLDAEESFCNCSCHKIDEQQTLKHHCISCGLRFLQGKVYCQTGKGLKPVNITFPFDPDIDHKARLGITNKKFDQNLSKRLNSPVKETSENKKHDSEDIDKKKNFKTCKSPRKTKPKPKKLKEDFSKSLKLKNLKQNSEKVSSVKSNTSKRSLKTIGINQQLDTEKNEDQNFSVAIKAGSSLGQLKRLADYEWKNSQSADLDHNFSDSDDNSKANVDKRNSNNINDINCDVWRREEDKIILESFQQNVFQEAIDLIAKQLKNRSKTAIQNRFEKLMTLLQEMES